MARLIDVDKVINSMQKCLDENTDKKGSVAYFTFEALITALKQEPTVDAVPVVHGRWNTDEKGVTYCGRCRIIDDYASVHNYCPNCGAKMDLEVE